jgi:hypothetical protein
MCRLFKSLAGCAPGDYRRESRIANNPQRAAAQRSTSHMSIH